MRLIDADELKELIDWTFAKPPFSRKTIKHMIDMARTVDAVPVIHGKWIDEWSSNGTWLEQKCSECGVVFEDEPRSYRYCPNCGARMGKNEID